MKKNNYLLLIFLLIFSISVNAQNETIGPWNISELKEIPNWTTSNVDAQDGVTGILYESLDYLGEKVEVFAYYSAPNGTPPVGGWPAVVFAHGGGGTAFPEVLSYWNDKGYAAISMDLEGEYPNGAQTPNPGPSRVGVWDDYTLPIEEQWYYHAIAQVLKAHSLIASFTEVNANKIGVMGASWGGTITSTVMGVDNRLAWAIPVYGGGYLSESDGHQGDSIRTDAEANFVNTYYDGSAYFNNVTFPTLWLNGLNDFHFSLSVNQKSSQSVRGPINLLYADDFPHGNLTWRRRNEVYRFANSVVNGAVSLPQIEKPYINSNIAFVNASSDIGINSAQLFYTNDGETIDLNDKTWQSINATISMSTISAAIPANAEFIFFEITDSEGFSATSEYLSTSETEDENNESGNVNLALNGNASQSSTTFNGDASRAIDGNTNGAYSGGSVTHTDSDDIPYWQVRLDSEYAINDITIFGRTDACCLERLSNFTVIVLDSSGARTFVKTYTTYPDPSITINLDSALGELVRIRSNNSLPLSLAEVEIYGPSAECADFTTIEAEDFSSMSGVQTEASLDTSGGEQIGYINNGDWSMYSNIDLSCANSASARISSRTSGGNIEIRLDGISGELIGTIPVGTTNSWANYSTVSSTIKSVTGIHNVYLVYTGGNGFLFNINSIEFSDIQVQSKEIGSVNNSNRLLIYPNPVQDQFTISLDSGKTVTYSISDMNGKVILSGILEEDITTINANELSTGLYLVQIYNEIEILTGKIIKL